MDEFNGLFQAYLQLDSYQAFNYIHSMETHNFSLELVFILKYQLLSTYKNFFYVKLEEGDEYAFFDPNTKIVVINEYSLFGPDFKEEEIIKESKNVNDYAMPLSMNFLHENGGHYKFKIKNHNFNSSYIYFRGLKIELELANYNSIIVGESGRIIENFICKDKNIIKILSSLIIFGEFFKIEYFNKKDFKNLIRGVIQKYNSSKCKDNIEINNVIETVNKTEKNYNNNDIFNALKNTNHFVKIGDIIINIEKFKRNALITDDEKKESFKRYSLNRKKKLNDLKKRRVNNNY